MNAFLTTLPSGRMVLSCLMALMLVVGGNLRAGEITPSLAPLGIQGVEGLNPNAPFGENQYSFPVNATSHLVGGQGLGIEGIVTVDNRTDNYVRVNHEMLSTDSTGIISGIVTLEIYDSNDNLINSQDVPAYGRARVRRIARVLYNTEPPEVPVPAALVVDRISTDTIEVFVAWETNRESDIAYYNVFVNQDPDALGTPDAIIPHSREALQNTTSYVFLLNAAPGENVAVYVSAVDFSGNESQVGGFEFQAPAADEMIEEIQDLGPPRGFVIGDENFQINYLTTIAVRGRFLNLRERQPYFFFLNAYHRTHNGPTSSHLAQLRELDPDLQGSAIVSIPRVHLGRSLVSLENVRNAIVGFFVEQDKLQTNVNTGRFYGRNAGSVFSESMGYQSGGPFYLFMRWLVEEPTVLGTSYLSERVGHFRVARAGFHSIDRDLGINFANTQFLYLLYGDSDQITFPGRENILRRQIVSTPAAINILGGNITIHDYLQITPPEDDDDPPIIVRN